MNQAEHNDCMVLARLVVLALAGLDDDTTVRDALIKRIGLAFASDLKRMMPNGGRVKFGSYNAKKGTSSVGEKSGEKGVSLTTVGLLMAKASRLREWAAEYDGVSATPTSWGFWADNWINEQLAAVRKELAPKAPTPEPEPEPTEELV